MAAIALRHLGAGDGTDVKTLRGENESLKGQVNELKTKAAELKKRMTGVQADLAALQARKGNARWRVIPMPP